MTTPTRWLLSFVAVLGLSTAAFPQGFSSFTSSNAGSTCSGGNNADGFCTSSVQRPINNSGQIQSRYAWNINADVGVFSTRDTSGNAQHNLSFSATAVGGYRLDIATTRLGDINRINDASGCDGSADTSGTSGSSNIALSSGSLSLGDPGGFGAGGDNTSTSINQSSSAVINRVSNNVAQSHSMTFTWNGNVRSNSCEAAVRMGEQNGTTTDCSACGYAGDPSRNQNTDGHFVTVNFTSLCGNGTVDSSVSEQCDEGGDNGSSTSCCTSQCQFRTGGQVCRTSAGVCDTQETCTGSSGACPADAFVSSATVCRPTGGAVCDVAENCTGSTAACPPNGFVSASTVCRPSGGNCDVAENCTGSSATCPANSFLPSSTVCRPSGGNCDVAENCTGSSATCPGNSFLPSSTVCRGAAGVCDVAENCTGSGATCPGDAFQPSSTVCRGAGGVCDVAESCTGSTALCPGDAKLNTQCRPSAGDCDPAETCDGLNNACPADTLTANGVECRAAGGVCDVAEACDGASPSCPADLKATTECRPAAGVCDSPDICDGVGNDCPADSVKGAFVVCRASAGSCDPQETCDGVGVDCPSDSLTPGGTECRAAGGVCDIAEICDGATPDCPADLKSTDPCRGSAGVCDPGESCDGVNDDCPADVLAPSSTVCRPSSGACDVAESCTGSSASCPGDTGLPDGDGDGTCDAQDNCLTTPNPLQENGDADTLGDACDLCTNSAPTGTLKTKLTATKLLAPTGDDKIKFKGEIGNVPSTPTINPVANGIRILVIDSAQTTLVDATIPPGAYNPVTRVGWKVNGSATTWTYKNAGNPTPLIEGLTKVQLKRVTKTPGLYKFNIAGKNGTYATTNIPVTGIIILDPPLAETGQCAEVFFPGPPPVPSCVLTSAGKNLKCK